MTKQLSPDQQRQLYQATIKEMQDCVQRNLRNGRSFLGSDGKEHAIKVIDRSNRIISGETDKPTKQPKTRICKNKECRKPFVPYSSKQTFCDRECQQRDQSKRQQRRLKKQKALAANTEVQSVQSKTKPISKKTQTPRKQAAAAKKMSSKRSAAKSKKR